MKDIIVIGAGVVGSAIARELSKYELDICVVEKDYDIANGTSKANSGIVHAGEDPIPGTLKAQMNIKGNAMFDELQKELNFPFRRNGSLVLCFHEEDRTALEELKERGIQNGVPEESMHVLSRTEALELEPHLSDEVKGALYLETGGIVGPYEFTIALAENAATNGVEFLLNTKVEKIEKVEDIFKVYTNKGVLESKLVINAAGVYADTINNMISETKYHIIPRRGEYILLDKVADQIVDRTLFQLPTKMGKGVLVTPTAHGNVLLGPTATDSEYRDNVETTRENLDTVLEKTRLSIEKLPLGQMITGFAGLRAHEEKGDFVIGEASDVKGFINALGIESPGLTSAPAIAECIRDIVIEKTNAPKKADFNPIRKGIVKFSEQTEEGKKALIKEDVKYGNIICRCETITEAEILQAIRGPIGATTVDGVKKRTRAGMGRCQGGFCVNKVVEILSHELGLSLEEVKKAGTGSELLISDLKAELDVETELDAREAK